MKKIRKLSLIFIVIAFTCSYISSARARTYYYFNSMPDMVNSTETFPSYTGDSFNVSCPGITIDMEKDTNRTLTCSVSSDNGLDVSLSNITYLISDTRILPTSGVSISGSGTSTVSVGISIPSTANSGLTKLRIIANIDNVDYGSDVINVNVLDEVTTCPENTTGTYPNCICPEGTGTYPNCACPEGSPGEFPECGCMAGTNGIFPDCGCGDGEGTYPNCICPAESIGTFPNCSCGEGIEGTYPNCSCPDGQGTYPNCTCGDGEGTFPNCTCGDAEGSFPDCSCPVNQGTFPNCTCGDGEGTFPNCNCGDAEGSFPDCSCGIDYAGTFPSCSCLAGTVGTYPNCSCPVNQGTYPNCDCGTGTGTFPNCSCQSGYTGTFPNCTLAVCVPTYVGYTTTNPVPSNLITCPTGAWYYQFTGWGSPSGSGAVYACSNNLSSVGSYSGAAVIFVKGMYLTQEACQAVNCIGSTTTYGGSCPLLSQL